MDSVGATHAQRVALLKGATAADLAELANVLDDEVASLGEHVTQGGVAQIRAGHAVVNPTAGLGLPLRHPGVHVLAHVGEKGDHVVMGHRLDGVHLILVKARVLADIGGILLGDPALAELRLGLACEHLDLLPDGVLILQREDVRHLGTRVTVDHDEAPFRMRTRRLTPSIVRAETSPATLNGMGCRISRGCARRFPPLHRLRAAFFVSPQIACSVFCHPKGPK